MFKSINEIRNSLVREDEMTSAVPGDLEVGFSYFYKGQTVFIEKIYEDGLMLLVDNWGEFVAYMKDGEFRKEVLS